MNKLQIILKKRLVFSGLLFFFLLGLSAAFALAGTVSNSNSLDVTAIVGNVSNNNNGGGGGNPPSVATVTISGNAFPNAKLTLLKDGAITTTLYADTTGFFQITINNLNFGNYQFSVYAEDPRGVTSNPYTVNVSAFSSAPYQFSGIVIPPTISSDSTAVQLGHDFVVSGYVAPGSNVTLGVAGGAQFGTAVANNNGLYQITAHATGQPNVYSLRTQATLNGNTSLYSRPIQVQFYAGQQPPPVPPPPLGLCVDYNKDRRVNLIDFSILLFWFGHPNPPGNIDCNSDHVIDMKDFSILMFYWTG